MKFKGGVHPAYNKDTGALAVEVLPLSTRFVVPVSQHLGAPGKPLVEKGQAVAKGQPLSEPAGFVSVPVHAPTSGVVKSVKDFPHPMGTAQTAIEIEADGEDRLWEGVAPVGEWRNMGADDLRAAIRAAGVCGMGGATFPTHVKLSPPAEKPIDVFILNGAECEPYLTSDHRVMVERPADVMEGVGLMMSVLGVVKAAVGVESNKPEALRKACPPDLDVDFALLETKYPQGSEKHLIYALTGREVPAGGLPMDVGVVVQNVGTAVACLEAVRDGLPMIERVVTVTGPAVKQPRNLLVRVGAPLQDVLDFCGGLTDDVGKVIYGGPMMGVGQHSLDVPVIKGTSGVLCLRERDVALFEGGPCIRCGSCVDVCPMGLVPSALGLHAERERFADLGGLHVADCIECGSCAYVCPAHRPLVQHIRRGKAEWRAVQKKLQEQNAKVA